MTDEKRAELEQKYLLALLTRDAKIWRRRATRSIHALDDDEEQLLKPKKTPKTYLSESQCSRCGGHLRYSTLEACVRCADAKAARIDGIKADAMKRTTPPLPRGRGLGIRPSQQLSDRAAARRTYLGKLARAALAGAVAPATLTPPTIAAHEQPTAISARAAARLAGAKRYLGEPCSKCGNRVRYVSHCGCVECHKLANARHKRAQRAAKVAAAAPAPVTAVEPRRLRSSQLRPPGPGQNVPFRKLAPLPKGPRFASK